MGEVLKVMPLRSGERWLAIDASVIEEVVGGTRPAPLGVLARPAIGLVAWRGRSIAALDLGETPRSRAASRLVIVRAGGAIVAIEADAVLEVRDLDNDLTLVDPAALVTA